MKMKIAFHPELAAKQKFTCNRCARCCKGFLVPVGRAEREAIEGLRDWRKELGVGKLFVRSRAAGRAGYGLAKHADGRCVFLSEDDLCRIHSAHGLKAKPLACRLYPFVLTPFAEQLRVGLRFDCPAVCENEGQSIAAARKELTEVAELLVPAGASHMPLPAVYPGCRVEAGRLEAINEVLVQIAGSDAMDLPARLHWLRLFVGHLGKVKWNKLPEEDFDEFVKMLQGGLLAEIQRRRSGVKPVTGKKRKLLGQMFFLLSQPTTIITGSHEGMGPALRKRLNMNRAAKQLRQTSGPLPKVQPDWPDCDLAELETSFGRWPDDVQAMLARYLLCRVSSMGYFGPNFYRYSLSEGADSLLLGLVTIGWLMRIEAVKAGRRQIELPDAHRALLIMDGNMGYARALGFGPSRLRLNYLREYLEEFIECYCQ